jgi:hypothetical protein
MGQTFCIGIFKHLVKYKNIKTIINIDIIDEFLYENTAFSKNNNIDINDIYIDFMCWLNKKHKINTYNKNIFINKILLKKQVINNNLQNIKMINMIDTDILRV